MAELRLASGDRLWVPRSDWVPRVVAVDEDGTFLSTPTTYDTDRFEVLWPRMAAAGTRFVVATGNQYWQVRDLFPAHADEIGYVTANGGYVEDVGGERVYAATAPVSAVTAVVAEMHQAHALPLLMSGVRGAYVEHGTPDAFVATLSRYFHRIFSVDDLAAVDDQVFMFSTFAPEGECRAWMRRYVSACDGALHAVYSGDGFFDLVVPGVSKAAGLAALCARWDVAASDVAAFGDGENDLEMLGWAAGSYAMANAPAHVRAAAGGVAPANTDSGVLQVLEAWFGA